MENTIRLTINPSMNRVFRDVKKEEFFRKWDNGSQNPDLAGNNRIEGEEFGIAAQINDVWRWDWQFNNPQHLSSKANEAFQRLCLEAASAGLTILNKTFPLEIVDLRATALTFKAGSLQITLTQTLTGKIRVKHQIDIPYDFEKPVNSWEDLIKIVPSLNSPYIKEDLAFDDMQFMFLSTFATISWTKFSDSYEDFLAYKYSDDKVDSIFHETGIDCKKSFDYRELMALHTEYLKMYIDSLENGRDAELVNNSDGTKGLRLVKKAIPLDWRK